MHPLRWIAAAGATARREAAQAARITVCAACAWQIALWLGASNPPVFAALVPLVALQGDPFAVIGLSLERVAGVVAGIAIGIAAIHLTSRSTATLAVTLAAAFAVGMVLRVHGRQNVQVAISALLVLSVPDPGTYGHERLWETGVGAAVAILLGPFLWPPNPLRELREGDEAGRSRPARGPAAHGAAGRHSSARGRRQRDARPRSCPVGPACRRRRAEGRTGGPIQPAAPLAA